MRTVHCGLVLAAMLACVTACATSGGEAPIDTGTYLISNGVTTVDTCEVGDFATNDGLTTGVVVDGNAVRLVDFGIDFVRIGSALLSPTESVRLDWTTSAGQIAASGTQLSRPFDCVETDLYDDQGTIVGKDRMSFAFETQYTTSSGTASECIAANDSAFGLSLSVFPCDTRTFFDLSR